MTSANSSRQSSVESSAAVLAAATNRHNNSETKRLSGCADMPVAANTRLGNGSARNSLHRGSGMGYEAEPCSQNIKSCSPILPMKLSQVKYFSNIRKKGDNGLFITLVPKVLL